MKNRTFNNSQELKNKAIIKQSFNTNVNLND
jgi:hypothetical protein